MTRHHDNLVKMGSTISDTRFTTMIMSSLPPSYCSVIQTITAAERVGATQGTSTKQKIPPSELIAFFTEEVQHCVIDDECRKAAESALLAHRRKEKKCSKQLWSKTKSDKCCENCGKNGHSKVDCWLEGGGKEGQGPKAKANLKKSPKIGESAIVADASDNNSFAFICTTDHSMVSNLAYVLKETLGACIDSRASCHYFPDQSKFINY